MKTSGQVRDTADSQGLSSVLGAREQLCETTYDVFSHFTVTSTKHISGLGTSKPSQPGLCLPPPPTMQEMPSGLVTRRHPPPGMMTVAASLAGLALRRAFVGPTCTWLAAVDTVSILTPGMSCR